MKLKMGFLGFGKSAKRYHLPYLNLRENIEVKTFYNRSFDESTLAQYQAPGRNFTKNIADLLDDPEIKLISICTPASTHYDFAKQALLAGKNLIVEKPFCDSLEHAKELLDLANSKGLMIMPFQNRRFDSDYLAAKQVIERGYLGKLLELEAHFDYFRPAANPAELTSKPAVEGAFFGLGIHTIDRIIALFGRPEKVAYDVRSNQKNGASDDYFDVDLHYGNGFKAKVKTSHIVASPYPQFILHGTKGSFIKYGIDQQENDLKAGIFPGDSHFGALTPEDFGKLKYLNPNGDWIEKSLATPVGDYGKVYDAAFETLINQAPKLVTDEEILTCIEILEGGFKAPNPSVYTLK